MANMKILIRSSSKQEQKIISCAAFISCLIMAVNLRMILKSYLRPPPNYFDHVDGMEPIICNFSNSRSDVYEITGDVRIHGISSTIFVASSHDQNSSSWTIKPYARKFDPVAMKRVTSFKIKTEAADKIPHCSRTIGIPAILFSAGGHAGNYFHAFADVLIPLFMTSHHFNHKMVFLMTNQKSEWTSKYKVILEKLTKYDVYDIDKENEVLCFSKMIIGLKAPDIMEMDFGPSNSTTQKSLETEIGPSKSTISIRNFTKLLQLKRESVHDRHQTGTESQPRMLIISRGKSRKLMNEQEIGNMARSLGFDVVVKQPHWNVSLAADLVNSVDVMVGVHGAGLTNMIFLPENAIVIQIIPFGLDYFNKICYESDVENMKLRYLKYNVRLNESSLLQKYPPGSEVYNPHAIYRKGFDYFRTVYLDNQDVNLDLNRFRKTLLRALELIGS